MKLEENFNNLDLFLEESFDFSENKYSKWNSKNAHKALEVLGFKKWDLSFDALAPFPSFWVHEDGLYALLDNKTINMVVLGSDFQIGDYFEPKWKSTFKKYIENNFLTPYGYRLPEISIYISSFRDLREFYHFKKHIKNTLPLKKWSPIVFNSMAEKLASIKNFGVAYFKDALNGYVDECKKETTVKLKEHAINYLNTVKVHKQFDTSKNNDMFLDFKIVQIIKKIMPDWYVKYSDFPIKEKEIKAVSDFLHGHSDTSWEKLSKLTQMKKDALHPLFWLIQFTIEIKSSVSNKLDDLVPNFAYKVIDDMCEKLSVSELKDVWEHEEKGKRLLFDCLYKNEVGLSEIEYFFHSLRKNSKIEFLNESIFNFKTLHNNNDSYRIAIMGEQINEFRADVLNNGLLSLLTNTPELFKKEDNNDYLNSFLSVLAQEENGSASCIISDTIKMALQEREISKKLTPSVSSSMKGPRF